MSTKERGSHFVVLSDDEGQLYAINRLQLHQYRIAGDGKEFLEKLAPAGLAADTSSHDNTRAGVGAYRILGAFSENSLR